MSRVRDTTYSEVSLPDKKLMTGGMAFPSKFDGRFQHEQECAVQKTILVVDGLAIGQKGGRGAGSAVIGYRWSMHVRVPS